MCNTYSQQKTRIHSILNIKPLGHISVLALASESKHLSISPSYKKQ